MKKQIITAMLLMTTGPAFAGSATKTYDATVSQITALESAGKMEQALFLAASASQQAVSIVGAEKVVTTTNTTLNEVRQQVITGQYHEGVGGSLLGIIKGRADHSWDTAAILTTNPEEVEGFGQKTASDYASMQKGLLNYVKQNETTIVYAKLFAAKTLQLALKLSYDDLQSVRSTISATVQKAQLLTFYGRQDVVSCVTTNYADRDAKASFSIKSILFNLNMNSDAKQLAYRQEICDGSTHQAAVSEAAILSGRIGQADSLIEYYDQQLGLKEVQESHAPFYPTWGLPAYN